MLCWCHHYGKEQSKAMPCVRKKAEIRERKKTMKRERDQCVVSPLIKKGEKGGREERATLTKQEGKMSKMPK